MRSGEGRGECRVKTDLVRMTPDIEFTRPDALWDMERVEQQSNHVGDDTQTEWGYFGKYQIWLKSRLD